MVNLTLLIPIHELTNQTSHLLKGVLDSIKTQTDTAFKTVVVCNPSIEEELNSKFSEYAEVIPKEKDGYSFTEMINHFVNEICDTEWFTVIQMDDTFNTRFVEFINIYVKAYSDIGALLPLNINMKLNEKGNNQFLGFRNESAWASGIMDELGLLDRAGVEKHNFSDYTINGATFNTISFAEAGGFKESLKLFFDMELCMRMIDLGYKLMVLPRALYTHLNERKGSMHDDFLKLSKEEIKFWYQTALNASYEIDDPNYEYNQLDNNAEEKEKN